MSEKKSIDDKMLLRAIADMVIQTLPMPERYSMMRMTLLIYSQNLK